MSVEEETRQNTKDIAALTTTVTEIATMFKYSEDRNREERESIKSMVTELKGLNEKMTSIAAMQVEITGLAGEVGKWRHEIDNIKNGLQAFSILREQFGELKSKVSVEANRTDELVKWRDKHNITELETTVKMLNEWKLQRDGAAGAVKTGADWFKSIVGPAISNLITAVIVGAAAYYFAMNNSSYSRSSTYIQKGVIGGE